MNSLLFVVLFFHNQLHDLVSPALLKAGAYTYTLIILGDGYLAQFVTINDRGCMKVDSNNFNCKSLDGFSCANAP